MAEKFPQQATPEQIDAFDAVLQQAADGGLTVSATGTLFAAQVPQSGISETIGFAVALA